MVAASNHEPPERFTESVAITVPGRRRYVRHHARNTALCAIAHERGACEVPGAGFVGRFGTRLVARGAQRIEYPEPHLGRGLDRERDGGDLLGAVHAVQQREETLDEELGLPGTGGRLHDLRQPRVTNNEAKSLVQHPLRVPLDGLPAI